MDSLGWLASAVVIRVGLILLSCGSARAKFVASTLARALLDWAATVLICYLTLRFWQPQLIVEALTVTTLATGFAHSALSERGRLPLSLLLGSLVSFLICIGLVLWHTSPFGTTGPVVYYQPGHFWSLSLIFSTAAGLFGAKALGSRLGKFHRDGSISVFPGHSLLFSFLGAFIMASGSFALVTAVDHASSLQTSSITAQSAAASAPPVTAPATSPSLFPLNSDNFSSLLSGCGLLLAYAAALVVTSAISLWRDGKVDVSMLLPVMVAVLPLALIDLPQKTQADAWFVGGIFVGLFGPWAVKWLERSYHLDDASGHCGLLFVCASTWWLANALISNSVLSLNESTKLLLTVFPIMAIVAGIALGFAAVRLALLVKPAWGRISDVDDYEGLDLIEHDTNAYPDFQQTMIKSHHLRQQ